METASHSFGEASLGLADLFDAICAAGGEFSGVFPDVFEFLESYPEATAAEKLRVLRVDQFRRHLATKPLPVEQYLGRYPELLSFPELAAELIAREYAYADKRGASSDPASFAARFTPELRTPILRQISRLLNREDAKPDTSNGNGAAPGLVLAPTVAGRRAPPDEGALAPIDRPERIGRYRVDGVLGRGGFGCVYMGFDEELARRVAIKVPHRYRLSTPEDVSTYINEARILARLDHTNIVPIHDFGHSPDGSCYVVSKYIDGSDLAKATAQRSFSPIETAMVTAEVAGALHYVHSRGLVHRDIKPGNILIDRSGRSYIVDFGLALKEEDFGKRRRFGVTPPYMSPEQARGEGHLVDGRSDIFSLGTVLYELLTGVLPFSGHTREELAQKIESLDPVPPRRVRSDIPRELERICLRALSKRASDRYPTGQDMAEDLHHFANRADVYSPLEHTERSGGASLRDSSEYPPGIIPKGLRSFDSDDADFYCELLPGPRDRNGIPEIIRFWRSRITSNGPGDSLRVGVIYGPSGFGKSSLVRAGLLPRLPEYVEVLLVSASANDLESRVRATLQKAHPELAADQELPEALASLRRNLAASRDRKLLLVIDQFETWLHKPSDWDLLVRALRQCDGTRVQCLLVVRDDFWLAMTRFLRDLDVLLVERESSTGIDLFDTRHARWVLAAFGQALGALPPERSGLSYEQEIFLDRAIDTLANEGKVIPVRLALFTEVVKDKPWTPATLKEIGGAEGVDLAFLEKLFSSTSSPPLLRLHDQGARRVLEALLPGPGSHVRGTSRSHSELQEIAGYGSRPDDFDVLMDVLSSEARLVSPTDPGQQDPDIDPASGRLFHLTHEHIVPALRAWLTRKRQETRRGQLEIRLSERERLWSAKRERRQLPSFWEWLNIRIFTIRRAWSPTERKMMRAASKLHLTRAACALLAFALVALLAHEGWGRLQATALRDRLLVANVSDASAIIEDFRPYLARAGPLLRSSLEHAAADSPPRLNLHLALLRGDDEHAAYLKDKLLRSAPKEHGVIRDALTRRADGIDRELWTVLEDSSVDASSRFRAAAALASMDRNDTRWTGLSEEIATWFVSREALEAGLWVDAFRPLGDLLREPLKQIFISGQRSEERYVAALILSGLHPTDVGLQLELIASAEEGMLRTLVGRLTTLGSDAVHRLETELERAEPPGKSREERELSARRTAHLALAMALLDRTSPWLRILSEAEGPLPRTLMIHSFAKAGVSPRLLLDLLRDQEDPLVRQAVLLSLGEYRTADVHLDLQDDVQRAALNLFVEDPHSGVHSAARWMLCRWGHDSLIAATESALRGCQQREGQNWYLTSEGHTMAILHGPVDFVMGSSPDEPERLPEQESPQPVTIPRTFAIACMETTSAQFHRYSGAQYSTLERAEDSDDLPANTMTYNEATQYCNWLSAQEGIPQDQWCYPEATTDRDGHVVKVVPHSDYLDRVGYRLPTTEEWEYACRHGTTTSWHYGDSSEYLEKYAWYRFNAEKKVHPVGLLKPNQFGLFDMHGNVSEYCQTFCRYEGFWSHVVRRGGSYDESEGSTRSAFWSSDHFAYLGSFRGFRVARTMVAQEP